MDRYNLWNGKPFKSLVEGLSQSGGRNNTGRISVWHQGGGHKRLYRRVDFWRKDEADSVVKRIEYDPNRGARIALVEKIPHTGMQHPTCDVFSVWQHVCEVHRLKEPLFQMHSYTPMVNPERKPHMSRAALCSHAEPAGVLCASSALKQLLPYFP